MGSRTRKMTSSLKKLSDMAKQGIARDPELLKLLRPFFSNQKEVQDFINQSLEKIKTKRMLLRLQWFSEIADDFEKIRANRPALKLIFLMSLAEGVANQNLRSNLNSTKAVEEFFKHISSGDKKQLLKNFRYALIRPRMSKLRLSSIIKILYNVRNKAVHGEDFWTFSFLEKDQKEKSQRGQYTHYGLSVTGYLGKKGQKRRIPLELTLTYEEFRDIIIRTAIANIQSILS